MARATYRDDLPHLRRGEAIGGGLRRVVRECCAHAVQRRSRRPTDEAVHEARRALKRARAALRLGEDLGATGARELRRQLGVVARKLSPRRDATIAREMAGRLATELREAKAAMIPGDDVMPGLGPRDADWWTGWQQEMRAGERQAGRMVWGAPAAEEVRRALHRSTKRVGRRAKKACARGSIARAHDWRKAVIVLREQVLIVRPLLTDKEAAACGKLHALAQRLGQATDYNVLREAVKEGGPRMAAGPAGNARFSRAAKRRRKKAVRKARKNWPKLRRALRERF